MSGSSPTPPAPLVSVIIPVYNLHQYLWQTIASVRAQSLEDWEVVVVDDGSDAPETVSAMDELARTADGEKLRVIRAPHGGLGHARNVGLHAARGRFVLPLDSDDMIAPTYMEQCVRVLRSGRNVGFVTAFLRHFTDDPEHPVAGWVPFGGDLEWMGVMNAASNACAMMPRELVLEVGGYDAELPAYEDWDLFASILERGYRGEVIPEFHILYRLRHASMMHTLGSQRHQLLRARLLAKHPGLSPHPSRTVRFMLGDCVDIYALGKQPERPSEDGRVFTRAQQLLHENMRYRIADKVNDVLRRAGVQGAVKRIVSGGD